MIKFENISESALEHFQGGEGTFYAHMFNDGVNKILKGRLEKGCSIGMHCHDTSSEIIFVLSGCGRMLHGGKEELLQSGDCHYCKKGESHSFIGCSDEPLIFYAVVPQQ